MFIYIGAAIAVLAYFAYRNYCSTTYRPGSVSRLATKCPGDFDDPKLVEDTRDSEWKMPDGISIYYELTRSSHENPTTVICVHGGPAAAPPRPWPLCHEEELLAVASFHTYHQRGCGRSSRPFRVFPTPSFYPGYQYLERSLGLGAQVADLERARRRIGAEKVALLGHSFGGFVATLYAAEFPQHVSSLILIAPANLLRIPQTRGSDLFALMRANLPSDEFRSEFDDFKARYFNFAGLPNLDERGAAALQQEFGTHFRRAYPNMYFPDEFEEHSIGGFATFATYLSLGIKYDLRPELTQLLMQAGFPVIIVSGDEDYSPDAVYEEYVQLFPRGSARWVKMPGGHFLTEEKPKALAQIVRELLAPS